MKRWIRGSWLLLFLTGCTIISDTAIPPAAPLNQAQIETVLRDREATLLSMAQLRNTTILLTTAGGEHACVEWTALPDGTLRDSEIGFGGDFSRVDGDQVVIQQEWLFSIGVNARSATALCLIITDPRLQAQMAQLTITLTDGTEHTATVGSTPGLVVVIPDPRNNPMTSLDYAKLVMRDAAGAVIFRHAR